VVGPDHPLGLPTPTPGGTNSPAGIAPQGQPKRERGREREGGGRGPTTPPGWRTNHLTSYLLPPYLLPPYLHPYFILSYTLPESAGGPYGPPEHPPRDQRDQPPNILPINYPPERSERGETNHLGVLLPGWRPHPSFLLTPTRRDQPYGPPGTSILPSGYTRREDVSIPPT